MLCVYHIFKTNRALNTKIELLKVKINLTLGTTEDEMVGRHHRLNRHEFEQTLGVGDGQGSLECCSGVSKSQTQLSD